MAVMASGHNTLDKEQLVEESLIGADRTCEV